MSSGRYRGTPTAPHGSVKAVRLERTAAWMREQYVTPARRKGRSRWAINDTALAMDRKAERRVG